MMFLTLYHPFPALHRAGLQNMADTALGPAIAFLALMVLIFLTPAADCWLFCLRLSVYKGLHKASYLRHHIHRS